MPQSLPLPPSILSPPHPSSHSSLWSLLQPTLTFPGLNTPWLLIPSGKCSNPLDPFTPCPCPCPCPCRAPPYMPFLFFEGAQPPSSLSLQAASSMKPASLQAAPARGPPSPWHFPSSLPHPQDSEIRSSQGLRRVHLCMFGGTRDMVGTQLKCLC